MLFCQTTAVSKFRYDLGSGTSHISGSKISLLHAVDLAPFVQLPERAIHASLSIVDIAMLIAAKHVEEEEKPYNFVIAYEKYVEHCKRAAATGSSSSRAFSRSLCLRVCLCCYYLWRG